MTSNISRRHVKYKRPLRSIRYRLHHPPPLQTNDFLPGGVFIIINKQQCVMNDPRRRRIRIQRQDHLFGAYCDMTWKQKDPRHQYASLISLDKNAIHGWSGWGFINAILASLGCVCMPLLLLPKGVSIYLFPCRYELLDNRIPGMVVSVGADDIVWRGNRPPKGLRKWTSSHRMG